MLENLWTEQLRQKLASLPAANGQPRIAVVGIGHELRGDDAAGVVLARLISEQPHSAGLQVVEAGAAPVNCCGLLLRGRPDLILFVDAADTGEEPGTVLWLGWQNVIVGNGSTHRFSLRVLADYLTREAGCPVALLGIQPADTAMGAALSPAVAAAVERTARALIELLPPAEEAARS
jgi:hydrogenase maturation protease